MGYSEWRRWNHETYVRKPWYWIVFVASMVALNVAVRGPLGLWPVLAVFVMCVPWAIYDYRRYRRSRYYKQPQ